MSINCTKIMKLLIYYNNVMILYVHTGQLETFFKMKNDFAFSEVGLSKSHLSRTILILQNF